jgi:hypothetical protein
MQSHELKDVRLFIRRMVLSTERKDMVVLSPITISNFESSGMIDLKLQPREDTSNLPSDLFRFPKRFPLEHRLTHCSDEATPFFCGLSLFPPYEVTRAKTEIRSFSEGEKIPSVHIDASFEATVRRRVCLQRNESHAFQGS